MKMFKSSMVWALVALVCMAQDASAGRFIVFGNTLQKFVDVSASAQGLDEGTYGVAQDGSFKVIQKHKVAFGSYESEWKSVAEEFAPLVIEVPRAINKAQLEQILTMNGIRKQRARAKELPPQAFRYAWAQRFYDATRSKVSGFELVSWQMAITEAVDAGNNYCFTVVDVKAEAAAKAPKPDAPELADNKDKKSEVAPKGLQGRFMSINAGYRYAGANVAMLVLASILQVMQDGYCGAEAKDIAEISVKRKALNAVKAVISLKKHASNVSAFYRVFRPVSEKGVVSPKFLARATQFAKNKPFIAAGLLGVTALNTYGVYSHAGDIKAYAKSFKSKKVTT